MFVTFLYCLLLTPITYIYIYIFLHHIYLYLFFLCFILFSSLFSTYFLFINLSIYFFMLFGTIFHERAFKKKVIRFEDVERIKYHDNFIISGLFNRCQYYSP